MSARLRLGLPGLLRGRIRRRKRAPRQEVLRGVMQNVIVVKPADPRFREALFILRDDYLTDPARGREELLREARDAARSFAETAPPRRPPRFPFWAVPVLLGLLLAGGRLAGMI